MKQCLRGTIFIVLAFTCGILNSCTPTDSDTEIVFGNNPFTGTFVSLNISDDTPAVLGAANINYDATTINANGIIEMLNLETVSYTHLSMQIGRDSITIESPPASDLPEVTIPFTSSNCIEYSGSPIFSISVQSDIIDKANANEYVTIDLKEFAKTNSSGKYFSDFRAALLLGPLIANTSILTSQLTAALMSKTIPLAPTILTYMVVCNSAMSTDPEYVNSSYAFFSAKIGDNNYYITVILRFRPGFTTPTSAFNAAPACSDHFTLTEQTITAKSDLRVSLLEPCIKALGQASSLISPMISIGGAIKR